jgi:hypothetical protein
MSIEKVAALIFVAVVGACALAVVLLRIPKKLKPQVFVTKWKELQGYCREKTTWPKALKEADQLLDKALKKRKLKGKSMGERMVSAQRIFTDNDGVWFAHNLCKKVAAQDPKLKLKESDVRGALVGFRQALRDLGALPQDNNKEAGESS